MIPIEDGGFHREDRLGSTGRSKAVVDRGTEVFWGLVNWSMRRCCSASRASKVCTSWGSRAGVFFVAVRSLALPTDQRFHMRQTYSSHVECRIVDVYIFSWGEIGNISDWLCTLIVYLYVVAFKVVCIHSCLDGIFVVPTPHQRVQVLYQCRW